MLETLHTATRRSFHQRSIHFLWSDSTPRTVWTQNLRLFESTSREEMDSYGEEGLRQPSEEQHRETAVIETNLRGDNFEAVESEVWLVVAPFFRH